MGDFYIPNYQRGYRWGENEVRTLLSDIYEYGQKNRKTENESYCLQPVVVRKLDNKYELIDGQQRLTTLYLIYVYMHKKSNGFMSAPKFSLSYETRDESATFLSNPDEVKQYNNIDFFFIYNAYKTIKNWFENRDNFQSSLTNINKYFDENVRII